MSNRVNLWLGNEQKTRLAGKSLAYTLYELPLTVFLKGDLGAGKTTFLQGFAEGLGIEGHVTSPTYALEQHYKTNRSVPFIHIDLYRLSPADAAQIMQQTDTHEGIRCVEWADRLESIPKGLPHILIQLEEKENGRALEVTFNDMQIPTDTDVERWRKEVALPQNVIDHCETVADVTRKLGAHLLEGGTIIRMEAVSKAGQLHDLLRFLDFKSGGSTGGATPDEPAWEEVRKQYPDMGHEKAISLFLHDRGFDGLSQIVLTHGLHHAHSADSRIEELLLFYADKRAAHDKIVTLRERFDDLNIRYGNRFAEHYKGTQAIEARIFPDGPPF